MGRKLGKVYYAASAGQCCMHEVTDGVKYYLVACHVVVLLVCSSFIKLLPLCVAPVRLRASAGWLQGMFYLVLYSSGLLREVKVDNSRD